MKRRVAVAGVVFMTAVSVWAQTPGTPGTPGTPIPIDCVSGRGAIRSGKTLGPSVDPSNPANQARLITLENFRKIKWQRGKDPTRQPAAFPTTRISPEEFTVYEIENLDLNSFTMCNGGATWEFTRHGDSIICPSIVAGIPPTVCALPYEYTKLINQTLVAYATGISIWSSQPNWAKECGDGGDGNRDGTQAIRIVGIGFWDDTQLDADGNPRLTLNPVLRMEYMTPTFTGDADCTGNPPDLPTGSTGNGSGTGGTGTGGNSGDGTTPIAVFPGFGGFGAGAGGTSGGSGTPIPSPTPVISIGVAFDQNEGVPSLGNSDELDLPLNLFSIGLSDKVTLSASSDPDGLDLSFDSATRPAQNLNTMPVLIVKAHPDTLPRDYLITVTASSGDVSSSVSFLVSLTCDTPFISSLSSSQPQSQTINSGNSATLSVSAIGTAPFSYQWYMGPSGNTMFPVNGATSRSFTTPPLQFSQTYWVRVTNPCGTADSNSATVTVH